ncbi:putative disease resistance protein, partial [Mucuna pruriens]
ASFFSKSFRLCKVFDFLLDLGIKHVAYIVYYRQNVDELNGSVKDLGLEKEKIEHQVVEAEKNLHNIEGEVTEWLRKVGEVETKVDEFGNDEGHRKTRLSNGLFPYLWHRHRLGRQAKKMVDEDVKKLIDELPKYDEVAYAENVTSIDTALSNAGYVEFGSRKSIMEDIMAQLEDSTVRMIGLHGPGGVGKSTLLKEIAKKAQVNKLFNLVVIVDITANPNPQKIQEEIAYVLQLRLEGEGEIVRADRLRRRLKKEKDNILVILDDLWDRLDLNKLGIPLDDDNDNEDDDLSNDK